LEFFGFRLGKKNKKKKKKEKKNNRKREMRIGTDMLWRPLARKDIWIA